MHHNYNFCFYRISRVRLTKKHPPMPKGRKKNDGRGRLGGRTTGTPNKDNTLKTLLHKHSSTYFAPSIPLLNVNIDNENLRQQFIMLHENDEMVSQYDVDLFLMKPADRVNAELSMLKYHTPQMQAVSADMSVKDANTTISLRLSRIANGENISDEQ